MQHSQQEDVASLKSFQLQAVHRMLAFNEEAAMTYDNEYKLPPAGSSHNQWKILIYDAACRSIISPIMSVQQLRRRGVTLHLLINSEREAIPDVPAIYFCFPTKENLARIAQDCASGLYQRAHLNFCTKLDRSPMEDFAKLVVQTGSFDRIASVHDQYLDYVCLEESLFSLHKNNSYQIINSSKTTEALMESTMTNIAYGLFSVVATAGQIPVIRCPRGGAPEMIARKVSKMIAEHPTLMRKKASLSRPLLVILDRNADLITPVQHCSTYQALIDDLLKHNANRVEFQVVQDPDAARPKMVNKKFDLDPDKDLFYKAHKFQPFPEAIESNGSELQEVTVREQEIRSKTSGNTRGASTAIGGGANDLALAVDSLPAMLDRKKQLEVHTSILQAVMNQVAARDVPQFYELESALATGQYKNDLPKAKKDVLALLAEDSKGDLEDKLRLLVVFALTTSAKANDLDEVTEAFQEAKVAAPVMKYLKQLRSMHMLPSANDMLQEMSISNDAKVASSTAMLSSLMAKATTQATGLLAKATDKVSGMLGKIHKHHATVVVENLCDSKGEDETYLYLDPKVKGDVDVAKLRSTALARSPAREVICFVVGGGSYGEYQNLHMLASDKRRISYGSTEVLNAASFLKQLEALGQD
mmetsp:Transcript_7518/g.9816  ORF Transcript_7518/g.9816 Transcript_7518/m.9816 type:complete len:644 (-) Transcript_7518:64-1995(-)|eukprot:CAMPEP_0198145758 /NCGR_PEP_ID=MMETSP1443-20131203/25175_1 /TAXON_ID=186043 /ORGANISM="Entomoneis sp., Strain CCMP2396" /LENGTH=643 /DNA_ID=CAMNT_0043809481 /DNA_START=141 /DNA_END=2072 /DNA_ORIENTATION=-